MNYLIALIIGFALGYLTSSYKHFAKHYNDSNDLVTRQKEAKEQGKQAIYELMATKSPLTNHDAQEMLGISDSSATRYFDELEKEGKVRQVGKLGRYVNYERT